MNAPKPEVEPLAVELGRVVGQLVEAAVARVVAQLGTRAPADVLTSRDLPADCPSPTRFNRVLASGEVAGATKVGRQWQCTPEAWRAARTRRRTGDLPEAEPDLDELIAANGLRIVGPRKGRAA